MTPAHQAALNTLRQAGFFILAWPPEKVAGVEADDLNALEEELTQQGNEFIDEHSVDEPGICPACSGSGEGQYGGTRCSSCKGRGEA